MIRKRARVLAVPVLAIALAANFPLMAQQQPQQPTPQQPPPEAKLQTAPQQPPPAKTVLFQPGVDLDSGQSAFPNIFAPYTPLRIDRPVLENTPRVETLIKEGQMVLTLEDAISLALENNLDIIVERYTPWIAEAGVLRAKAGLGTASGGFDPQLNSTFSWFRGSQPVLNPFLAGTGVLQQLALTNYRTDANFGYTQGFPTGTAFNISFNNSRQSTTSASQLFNPAVQSSVAFAFQQPLLNGLGFVSNKRFLRLARNTKRISDLGFNNQIILTVSAVQSMYWNLVFAREDVKVKQRSVELAQRLLNDNKRQVEIGTLAPIEVVRAEAEVARTGQELIVAQTFLLQQQTLLKNAITKDPLQDALATVEIVPADIISKPPDFQVAPLVEAVKEAWTSRPDVRQAQIDLESREVTRKATRNEMLPTLTLSGQYGGQGLAGNSIVTTTTPLGTFTADPNSPLVDSAGNPVQVGGTPVFVGSPNFAATSTLLPAGLNDAWSRLFNFEFPNYSVRLDLTIPIRNRAAQADNAQALLEERQSEARLRQLQNNIVVEVRNAQIALEQSRARVEAAQKSRELQERTLDAEQKKYQLGASSIFFVIQAQRDLAQAESAEVRALADLMIAKVEYDRALGRTLQVNNIQIADAQGKGKGRTPNIPGSIVGTLSNRTSANANRSGKY